MHLLDWIILVGTLAGIVLYGLWKSRNVHSSKDFLAGHRDLPWWTIGLSIMSTQASAITFLSTPGQGYIGGLDFVQFYFGMPIAMAVLCLVVLPVYYRLRVTTAYEYLEQRFDVRMRSLTSVLFLVQRGLSTAISVYAPGIILSAIFGWSLGFTNFVMAVFVVLYTTTGGSDAVSHTQKLQMLVMLGGLVLAFFLVLYQLPAGIGLKEAWQVAGLHGKTQSVDSGLITAPDGSRSFNWSDRYNLWSGLLASTFLFISYFGMDQSQVGRYLGGKSLRESRIGLIFNGIVKIPMQYLVLSVGVMVFVFYQFYAPPLYFNAANRARVAGTPQEQAFIALEIQDDSLYRLKRAALETFTEARRNEQPASADEAQTRLLALEGQRDSLRREATALVGQAAPGEEAADKDYIFIHFILKQVPVGLIGVMLAMIFCASWGSTAAQLSALSTSTVSDLYRRSLAPGRSDRHYFLASRVCTVLWGAFIVLFATYVNLGENLIQFVNMIGSVFYGTIMGIFFTAFFLKRVGGQAVFWAAVITQTVIIVLYYLDKDPYLWYNPLGCGLVMALSLLFQRRSGEKTENLT